jgi:hypothetical protein
MPGMKKASEEPWDSMPEAFRHRLFAGGTRHGTIAEKAADSGHVFFMLVE